MSEATMHRIGILGCGNMGAAIIRALAKSSEFITELVIYDIDSELVSSLATEVSAKIAGSVEELNESSELIILAVKPQILPSIFPILAKKPNQNYISIAAGVSLETLSSSLSSKQIIRFMPNIAASVGKALTAISPHEEASRELTRLAESIGATFGVITRIPEKQMSAFIGISGSAIAFFYQFLHAIALGGTQQGIPYNQSVTIAAETFSGAIELMKDSEELPASLITSVTSAGGTTIEGIHALEQGNFTGTVMGAVKAAAERGLKLEKQ